MMIIWSFGLWVV